MYMFDQYVHAANILIYRKLYTQNYHHVHVCVKFWKKVTHVIHTLQNHIYSSIRMQLKIRYIIYIRFGKKCNWNRFIWCIWNEAFFTFAIPSLVIRFCSVPVNGRKMGFATDLQGRRMLTTNIVSSSTARGETTELPLIPFPYSSAKSYRAIDGDA